MSAASYAKEDISVEVVADHDRAVPVESCCFVKQVDHGSCWLANKLIDGSFCRALDTGHDHTIRWHKLIVERDDLVTVRHQKFAFGVTSEIAHRLGHLQVRHVAIDTDHHSGHPRLKKVCLCQLSCPLAGRERRAVLKSIAREPCFAQFLDQASSANHVHVFSVGRCDSDGALKSQRRGVRGAHDFRLADRWLEVVSEELAELGRHACACRDCTVRHEKHLLVMAA
mmetsp:Transcript_34750/g.92661  ORF Transcript_34750/g.92661 Transcript_34750/m.92661 type:complete len:226 (+) Transcript_34750:661-1338(+)